MMVEPIARLLGRHTLQRFLLHAIEISIPPAAHNRGNGQHQQQALPLLAHLYPTNHPKTNHEGQEQGIQTHRPLAHHRQAHPAARKEEVAIAGMA